MSFKVKNESNQVIYVMEMGTSVEDRVVGKSEKSLPYSFNRAEPGVIISDASIIEANRQPGDFTTKQ